MQHDSSNRDSAGTAGHIHSGDMVKRRTIDADEVDVTSKALKKWRRWPAGERKRIKRKMNKRYRREGKRDANTSEGQSAHTER